MKPFLKSRAILSLTTLLALVTGLLSAQAPALEVFSWTDKDGVVHYTDRPPQGQQVQTIDMPDSSRPRPSAVSKPPESPVNTTADTSVDADSGDEQTEEKTAAQARRAELSKDRKERREAQAQEDRLCQRHSQRLAQIEPHRRVFYTDENGETVRMDDEKRVELVNESREYLAKNCD